MKQTVLYAALAFTAIQLFRMERYRHLVYAAFAFAVIQYFRSRAARKRRLEAARASRHRLEQELGVGDGPFKKGELKNLWKRLQNKHKQSVDRMVMIVVHDGKLIGFFTSDEAAMALSQIIANEFVLRKKLGQGSFGDV